MEHPPPRRTRSIAFDVSQITVPDAAMLNALARLALTARRLGTSIELHNACPRLRDLLVIAGLTDVLVVVDRDPDASGGSGVEMER